MSHTVCLSALQSSDLHLGEAGLHDRIQRRLQICEDAVNGEENPEWRMTKAQLANLMQVIWEFCYMENASMGNLAEMVK